MKATDVRGLIAKTGTAMLLATTGAVLLGVVMLAVFLLRPPLLGWVGLAVVCAIVIGLASFAAVLSPRPRVSAQLPAAASDAERGRGSSRRARARFAPALPDQRRGARIPRRRPRRNGTRTGLEHDLLAKAQALTPLEVSRVVVPSDAPARADREQQAAHAGASNGS